MTAILKHINRAKKEPASLYKLAQADYACTHKHLTARYGRIIHKGGR